MEHDVLLSETLERLKADPELGCMIPFRAMGWRVILNAEPEGLFRVRVTKGNTPLIDELMAAEAVAAYLASVKALEERRTAVMAARLARDAEAFLRSLA
jgi:hypothetical protein